MRLLIIGTLNGQLTTATKLAMDKGATVTHAADNAQALAVLRAGRGADLLMVDVAIDIRELVRGLEAEHIHAPIVACGTATDARAAVAAIHAGAKEYIPLPPDPELIAAVLAAVADDSRELIWRDDAMARVVKLAQQIAPSEASVLITGDSGTGKEVLARYVHARSGRAKKPLICVNCAAVPESLLESELFGHEKGAFTGAVARRVGKFEEANGCDAVARRDFRNGRAAAGQTAARHPGAGDRPRRRHAAGADRHPHHRHLQPQSRRGGARRRLPRGFAVPPQRREPENPAVTRAAGRRARARRIFRQKIFGAERRAGATTVGRGAAHAGDQLLARQRARIGKHHASRRAHGERRRDRARRRSSPPTACASISSAAPLRSYTPLSPPSRSRARWSAARWPKSNATSSWRRSSIASATARTPPMCSASRSARCATSSTNTQPTACRCRRPAAAAGRTARCGVGDCV